MCVVNCPRPIDRVNLIKMVMMLQLLYILHNSMLHIFFMTFKDVLRKKIACENKAGDPAEGYNYGGLTIPNPRLYFMASQLQKAKGWG